MRQLLVLLGATVVLAVCVAVLTKASWQPTVQRLYTLWTPTSIPPTATVTPSHTVALTTTDTPSVPMDDGCSADCGS